MISDQLMMIQSELNTTKYRNKMAIKLLINSGSYTCMAIYMQLWLYALVAITPVHSAFRFCIKIDFHVLYRIIGRHV